MGERKAAGMDGIPAGEVQDLLTHLVTEKYYADNDRWTEEEILDQVSNHLLFPVAAGWWADQLSFLAQIRTFLAAGKNFNPSAQHLHLVL